MMCNFSYPDTTTKDVYCPLYVCTSKKVIKHGFGSFAFFFSYGFFRSAFVALDLVSSVLC